VCKLSLHYVFQGKKILVISNQEGSGAVYFYWHAEWKCPDRNTDGNMLQFAFLKILNFFWFKIKIFLVFLIILIH
jgi:hypothetical protein